MKTIDLLKYGKNDISFYLAIEECLLDRYLQEVDDVFFLWDVSKAVICGKNQIIDLEVNRSYINKINAKIFRRPSGGGAVYADDGCFMFSFISKEKQKDIVYYNYLTLIKNALMNIGINADLSGRNDLLFMGKKFSGTSFYRSKNGSILHGTFLYDTNIIDLVKSLTVEDTKLVSKGIKSVKERVINLKEYLNMTKEQIMQYLLNYISIERLVLNDDDLEYIKLKEKKYKSDEWMNNKKIPYSLHNKKRYNFGLLDTYLDIRNNHIHNILISGDYFELKSIDEFIKSFIGTEFTKENIVKKTSKVNIKDYIDGACNEDFIDLLFEEEL